MPLLFIPALLLPGSWVHMLTTDSSVPDIVRLHLHFNQTCQRSVSMFRLEKSSSVLFLHQAEDKRSLCEAVYDLISMGLPASSVPLTPWESVSKQNPGLLYLGRALASELTSIPHPLFFSTHGNYCSVLFFPSK